VTLLTLVTLVTACSSGSSPARSAPLTPAATVGTFFQHYVSSDGRVVRVDQGGDTVSEGQAYAMLMAAAVGDRSRFMSVWTWTRQHLLLPDGLLAWHWSAGTVVGREPSSDGDLGGAAALVMAARRFADPSLMAAGRSLAAAIAEHEVAGSADGPTLVAGPWAVAPTEYVDPSYLAPAEMDELAAALGPPWPAIATTASTELETLTSGGDLPPDWAVIGSDHRIHPSAAPSSPGAPALFGFDAVRAPVWMATSCRSALRSAASGLLPALQRGGGEVELDLGGHPAPGKADPIGFLALAAGDWAAGHQTTAWGLVGKAEQIDQSQPTYYTTAWVALTVLAFDHRLGPC
jgi:endoglucanase